MCCNNEMFQLVSSKVSLKIYMLFNDNDYLLDWIKYSFIVSEC